MEDFVPYELAVKLKEKGFREKVMYFYDRFRNEWHCLDPINMNDTENCSAPTISQVMKWLREEKKIYIMINFWPAGYDAEIFTEIGKDRNSFCWERFIDECDYYDSYELAAIAGVNYVIDNLI